MSDKETMANVCGIPLFKLRSEAGFSLVEVAITLGISAFLALGSGLLITRTATEHARVDKGHNTKLLSEEIYRRCFSSNNLQSPCTFGTETFTVDGATTMAGVPITINIPQTGGATLTVRAGAQTQYGIVNRLQLGQLQCLGRTLDGQEVATATLRLSMRTGPTSVSRENNLGRFTIHMQVISGGECAGPRRALQATVQQFNNISAAFCQRLGLVESETGTRCRLPVSAIVGQAGGCSGTEFVSAINPIAGGGRSACQAFSAERCRANQMAKGYRNGILECVDKPVVQVVSSVPTTPTPAPIPPPQVYSPPPVSQTNIPGTNETHNNTDPCPEANNYRNCMAAVQFGANNQFGLRTSDCGPAPSCHGNGLARVAPNSAFPAASYSSPGAVAAPSSTQCNCGGLSINTGAYCGFCYWDVDTEPMPYSTTENRLMRSGTYNYRVSGVLQCQSTGQLTTVAGAVYPANQPCEGNYVGFAAVTTTTTVTTTTMVTTTTAGVTTTTVPPGGTGLCTYPFRGTGIYSIMWCCDGPRNPGHSTCEARCSRWRLSCD